MLSPQTSKAYQVIFNNLTQDHTSPTLLINLIETSIPKPIPGPSEVLVRVHAAALNYRDLLVLANSPHWIDSDDPSDYTVERSLGAGEVQGTLREYAVVEDELLLRKPGNPGWEEAAALPACVGTSMNVLGGIGLGERMSVLTQGTGGVSCAVIQLASALGARVIATSSSDEKLQAAKRLGAMEIINYKTTPNWEEEVLRINDGKGDDLVAEIGGSGTIIQSLEAAKSGGSVAVIGFLSQDEATAVEVIPKLIFGAKTCNLSPQSKVTLERGVKLVEQFDLHPIINMYELSNAPKAYEDLRRAKVIGKLVIRV
ncbi:putative zinc-type alcohol dehydrogenase-like protein [Amylocarpus encephaloides]|uniref:Zinc-type alcohol dehydrogenase-like protein n=1 Tax=Amylocarpus encephaloides TaxID=45428 RepID=A0A9P7YAD8_9HELO|nr:putative zinc-type alcohol dehydrogenase-like protein [Amylocarpus encephaloides]